MGDWVNNMDFSLQYDVYLAEINDEIEKISKREKLPEETVFTAMMYGLSAGGKRIRPVLTVAVCDALGGSHRDAIRVGCAIECIHNYSLLHDDLPCMDDDDLRRGRPTCHKVYGEATALLAGDGLLNLAFELLSDETQYESLSAQEILAVIKAVSNASGVYGMIGGQAIDLACENRDDVTMEQLSALHRHKTGDLIRVSALAGCLCAHVSEETDDRYQKILEYSTKLGLAFQIKDDILDVVGQEELLGKPIGSDAEEHKTTFVTLLGLEKAKEELDRITREAKNAIADLPNGTFLLALADYLLNREF